MSKVDIDIKALLEAGVHFGHNTSRWHPKMAPFIHSKRGKGHVIDLTTTVTALEEALPVISGAVAAGKKVLFVGTKRQCKDIVRTAAEKTDMPYVCERWMGGMLTNQKTIGVQIKKLKDLEAKMESGELANRYNKLEVQRFQEQIERMNHVYLGIKEMPQKPGAVFITDMIVDSTAVKEARKLGVPVIAIADTNVNPEEVDYPIPANDDAIKSIQAITDLVVKAVELGKTKQKVTKEEDPKKGE